MSAVRGQVVMPEGAQNQLSGIMVVADSFTNKGALYLNDSALFYFRGRRWQEDRVHNTNGRGMVVFDGLFKQEVGGSLRLYRMAVRNDAGVNLAGSLAIDSALHLQAGLVTGKNLYTEAASWVVRTGGSMGSAPMGVYNVNYPQYDPLTAGAELDGTGLRNVQLDNIAGVSISKDLQASGSVAGTGTLVFSGNSRQVFKAGAGFSLGQLLVQNASGVGLRASGIINNLLRLDGGKLFLQDQVLTLAADAAIEGYDRTHYIVAGTENSRLRRTAFKGSEVFPLGTEEHFLPVTVTQTATAPFGLGVFQGLTNDGRAGSAPVVNKDLMVDAVWITEAPARGATIRMEWPKQLEGKRFGELGNEQVGLWTYQGGWKLRNTPPVSVWKQGSTLSTVVSGEHRYAVGVNDSLAALLDISLQGKVVLDKSGVSLNWALNPWRIKGGTLYLEHSKDGVSFDPLYESTAVGMPLYTHVHQIPVKGVNYYRVAYVGPTGVKVYSNIAVVTYLDNNDQLEVYPNPTTGPVTLRFLTPNAGPAVIRIYNMLGQLLQTNTVELKSGVHILQANLSSLPAGMYLVKVRNTVVKVERLRQ